MPPTDEFTELRRRVMRRCVYALNALALRDDRVPRDGAFDAAAANALAAIVAYSASGREYENPGGRVKSPLALLKIVRGKPEIRTNALDSSELRILRKGIDRAKSIRHGGADEEWDILEQDHVDALLSLDKHPALQVLNAVDGMDFARAATELYRHEADAHLPSSPKERSMAFGPDFCDNCSRMTLIVDCFHSSGEVTGASNCIACGYERTEEDAEGEYLSRLARKNN